MPGEETEIDKKGGATMTKRTARLRILRAQRGWTREYLAEILGKSPHTVRGWENGSFSPNLDALLQMEKIFGVPGRELLKIVEV